MATFDTASAGHAGAGAVNQLAALTDNNVESLVLALLQGGHGATGATLLVANALQALVDRVVTLEGA